MFVTGPLIPAPRPAMLPGFDEYHDSKPALSF